MAAGITIARPYAKALFEYAHTANRVASWSILLSTLSVIVQDATVVAVLTNPAITEELQAKLLLDIMDSLVTQEDKAALVNFIWLLAHNKRLLLLSDMSVEYDALRRKHERTLTAYVTSFAPLNHAQQQRLIKSLSLRLQRQVVLEMSVDPALLGGAIIRAGDLVINGTVRLQLNKLGAELAA